MGVYSDFLSTTKTIDTGGADGLRIGNNRALHSAIDALRDLQGDIDYPAGFDLADEVQSIAIYEGSVTGGTFTITIDLKDVPAFTTAAIAYDANAATIESAIDTAATGVVTGWTNGDIAVTGGPLTTTPLTITYSGASVAGKPHSQIIINGGGLTGSGGVVNEVQSIAVYSGTVTGGSFALAFNPGRPETFETALIAHNANAATIQAAIDASAALEISGWTNGDIAITGGPLTTTPVTVTYSGVSVAGENHLLLVLSGNTLTGGGSFGAITTTTDGGGANEVQSVAIYNGTVSGGTFTLSFTLSTTESFTTAAIAHNANAATIQTAINTAAASVGGWTDGDIAITGGPLTTTPVTVTYSGQTVSKMNQSPLTINGASLTGGGTVGAVTTTTQGGGTVGSPGAATSTINGQSKRTAWAILKSIGVIAGNPPAQGTSAAVSGATTPDTNPHYPDQELIKALAEEAAIADDNIDVKTEILRAARLV